MDMDGLTLPENEAELEILLTVLEMSLLSGISDTSDSSTVIIILSIGSLLVGDRSAMVVPKGSKQLKGLEVRFEVVTKILCGVEKDGDCQSALNSVTSVGDGITDQLQKSLTDGSFASSLAENAADFGVAALENVSVDSNSFASEPATVEVSSAAPTLSPTTSSPFFVFVEAFILLLQSLIQCLESLSRF